MANGKGEEMMRRWDTAWAVGKLGQPPACALGAANHATPPPCPTHPFPAEVVLGKGPYGEMWPMLQAAVKEDHPSQAGAVPAQ